MGLFSDFLKDHKEKKAAEKAREQADGELKELIELMDPEERKALFEALKGDSEGEGEPEPKPNEEPTEPEPKPNEEPVKPPVTTKTSETVPSGGEIPLKERIEQGKVTSEEVMAAIKSGEMDKVLKESLSELKN